MLLPVASSTTSSLASRALPPPCRRSPRHINAAHISEPAGLPKYHLAKSSVNVNAHHRRIRTSYHPHDGSCGRHENYGFALSAQPGESQRPPATNSSSRLIVCIGLPAFVLPVPLSRRSHHTPRCRTPQRQLAPRNLIPVTNAIEALNRSKIIKIGGSLPNDEAAMKLLYFAIGNPSSTGDNRLHGRSRWARLFCGALPVRISSYSPSTRSAMKYLRH